MRIAVMSTAAAVIVVAFGVAPDPFTVVLLPDTQYYSLRDPETYKKQTRWIVANRDALRITTVIHLGDVTDKNNSTGIDEWSRASQAHLILDNAGIPYSITTGNHDYPRVEDEDRRRRDPSKFNTRFGPPRFSGKSWYGGHYGSGNENNYTTFEDGTLQFLVLSLEYAPPKDAMCWAAKVLAQHPERRAIVATHCYQGHGGGHVGDCGIRDNMVGANGDVLWEELIRQHNNVFLVVSGYVGDSEHRIRSRISGMPDESAKPEAVHEILTDYQFEKDRNATANGNGWLRTLAFRPSENRVYVETKSVLSETSLNQDDYSHDPSSIEHKFPFYYDMTSSPPDFGATPPSPDRFADRQVNSVSTRDQRQPRVAPAANGGWIAVWEDDSQGAAGVYQIYARGFDSNGCERFHDRTINSDPNGQQLKPAIASNPAGSFVVVWEDDSDQNGSYQIKARGFGPDGTQRFSQRTINAVTTGQQRRPTIAMDASGNFVVVWEDDSDGNGVYQIKARGFDAAGNQRIPQFTVNTVSAGQQLKPAIATSNAGDFVVVWEDDSNTNAIYQIKMLGFNASGAQRFSQKTVNAIADGQQRWPAIAINPSGEFVVVWQDDSNENAIYQIKGRGFNADGDERIAQFTVNATSSGQQVHPSIAMNAAGQFVVTFEDDGDQNGVFNIKGRGFDASGNEVLSQRRMNDNPRGEQRNASVALTDGGAFMVVWQDDLEKNGAWQVLGVGCNLTLGCRY